MRRYMRTCQECGLVQPGRDPATLKDGATDSWRDTKCKGCTSEALDYGSERCDEGDCDDKCDESGCMNLRGCEGCED